MKFLGRSRGQVPFANLAGGGREGAAIEREEGGGRSSPPPVSFCDIMTVFQRAVREVKAGQVALEGGEGKGGDSTYFNRYIEHKFYLTSFFFKFILRNFLSSYILKYGCSSL